MGRVFLLLWVSNFCFGQSYVDLVEFSKKAITGIHWIPHLAANNEFQSSIILRSDELNQRVVRFLVVFLLPSGENAMVTIVGQDGVQQQLEIWEVTVPSQGSVFTNVISIEGERSAHAIVFALIEPANEFIGSDRVSIETSYARVENGKVLSMVGGGAVKPTRGFKMNLDYTASPFASADKFRGLAIANTNLEESCNCTTFLINGSGFPVDSGELILQPRTKWLGIVGDLFPGASSLIQNGHGSIFLACDEEISVLGLAFQGSAFGTAPVTRFQ